MATEIDTKTKQLVDDLIHNPDKYESLITEYFDTFDIKLLNLQYYNFKNDIITLINSIKEQIKTINNLYTKETNNDGFNIDNIDSILDFFNDYKYEKFTEVSANLFIKKIDEKINDKIDNDCIVFKKYLENNINLLQSYYNIMYIITFIQYTNVPECNNILQKLCNQFIIISNKFIYAFQLYKEDNNQKKTHYDSKKLIDIMQNKNLSLLEVYNYIINNPSSYFKCSNQESLCKVKSKLIIDKIDEPESFNDTQKIALPQFYTKDIKQNNLKKTFGLCNMDLYTLLNNSSLPICHNNKSFYTLYNDIRIELRSENTIKSEDIYFDNNNNDTLINLIEFINSNIEFIKKGYFIHFNDNEILFKRNAIVNIDFTADEYENLDTQIKKCENRYLIIYCSQVPFNKNSIFSKIKKNFKGGHKVSLIIDKKKRELLFFDPFGMLEYSIHNININFETSIINILLALELSKNVKSLNNYKFLYYNNIAPQSTEHRAKYMDKLYGHNIEELFKTKKQELRDWAGGYCGLWNYFYIFLLVINPHMDLKDIYNFFYKITNINYSTMFVKLLIRNFAYYIENALITKNFIIPLVTLKLNQFEDIKIYSVSLETTNKNELQLNNVKSNAFVEDNSYNDFKIDNFTEKFFKLSKSLQENIVNTGIIYTIAKDFSKYIFAKGGLALYAPDKINFINV